MTTPHAVAAPSTLTPAQAAWQRAHDRAVAEQLVASNNGDGTYAVKAYTVEITGPRWSDLRCDCKAGVHDRICKHVACVVDARREEQRAIAVAAALTAAPVYTCHCVTCGARYAYDESTLATRLSCPQHRAVHA